MKKLPNYINNLLIDYKDKLIQNNIPLKKLIIFGSWAKGKQKEDSDIDVAVISDKFAKDEIEEMMIVNKLANQISPNIEAVSIREPLLKDKYNPLIVEISNQGEAFYA
jgi:predicted nucleotidyltransferase